jgi:hypothetical protein
MVSRGAGVEGFGGGPEHDAGVGHVVEQPDQVARRPSCTWTTHSRTVGGRSDDAFLARTDDALPVQ